MNSIFSLERISDVIDDHLEKVFQWDDLIFPFTVARTSTDEASKNHSPTEASSPMGISVGVLRFIPARVKSIESLEIVGIEASNPSGSTMFLHSNRRK